MPMNKILGAVVLAIGALLLGFAYNATNAPLEQLSETVTGRYSTETMWYLAIGAAAIVGGGLLVLAGSRK